MTVAVDVAVELGPRNRRRLTRGGIAFGLLAAVIAAAFFVTSPSRTGGGVSNRSRAAAFPGAWHIFSGMTKAQVLRLAGKPTTIQGRCWVYTTNFEFRGVHVDGVKACFYVGHVYERTDKLNGTWGTNAHIKLPASVAGSSLGLPPTGS